MLLELLDFIRILIKFLTFSCVFFSITINSYFVKPIQGCRKVLKLDGGKVSYQSFKNVCENARTEVFCGIFFFQLKKKYAENMKNIVGAVWELPAK